MDVDSPRRIASLAHSGTGTGENTIPPAGHFCHGIGAYESVRAGQMRRANATMLPNSARGWNILPQNKGEDRALLLCSRAWLVAFEQSRGGCRVARKAAGREGGGGGGKVMRGEAWQRAAGIGGSQPTVALRCVGNAGHHIAPSAG
mmetsp:Transcript_9998/g.31685  ORF Transcript_9998/g.31685 Transcript_9998/m.31685 type:complete len:146 (+) Transcript_9998:799-1236(+)